MNCILLSIKDDLYGLKEDIIPEYKAAFPGEQFSVRWGKGPLKVKHLENKHEVSTKELDECAFYDLTTNRIPFVLQPREPMRSRILVTLSLMQAITKDITFPFSYNDESIATEVLRTRPLTPTPVGSPSGEGMYEVTQDSMTETRAIALSPLTATAHSMEAVADRVVGVLAPPATEPNIVQEMSPGFSSDQLRRRPENVFSINVNEMVINNLQGSNPPGNAIASALAPVAVASVVPARLQHEIRCRLNRDSPVLDDWRGLAIQLGLEDYIMSLEQCRNPTEELLVLAESKRKVQNLGDLAQAFERMNRGDCQELCENYALETTKSACFREGGLEDNDADSSD